MRRWFTASLVWMKPAWINRRRKINADPNAHSYFQTAMAAKPRSFLFKYRDGNRKQKPKRYTA